MLLIVVVAIFFIQAIGWWSFTHDDAWITFRYAENLINGHGLVFNPGERVEGYTNFLWTVLMAIPMALGLDPVPVSKILGILFSLGSLAVFYFLTRSLLPPNPFPRPAASVLLLATFAPFAFWSIGGLETAMFGFMVLAGLHLALREFRANTAEPSASGLVMVLAALTRPDGLLFWAVGAVFVLIRRHFKPQALINWLVPFGFIYAPYFIWRWLYYGWLLPNTYYVRMGTDTAQAVELTRTGFHYWSSFLMTHGNLPFLLLTLIGLIGARFKGKMLMITVLAAWVLHIAHAGGDEKPFGRLILPVLPLMVFFAVEGIAVIFRSVSRPSWSLWAPLALTAVMIPFIQRGYYSQPDRAYVKDHIFKYCRASKLLGEWLRAHAQPGDTMATRAIGALGYYAKIPCFDLLGIVDEHIAHLPLEPGQLTAHGKSDLIHVIRKEPTYVVFMLMEPEKLGYRRIKVDLGTGAPFILFKRDPALTPDPEYMANPRENQGLLMPWSPEN